GGVQPHRIAGRSAGPARVAWDGVGVRGSGRTLRDAALPVREGARFEVVLDVRLLLLLQASPRGPQESVRDLESVRVLVEHRLREHAARDAGDAELRRVLPDSVDVPTPIQ